MISFSKVDLKGLDSKISRKRLIYIYIYIYIYLMVIFRWTQDTRTYQQLLCMDTGFSLEDLQEAMDDRDEWQESVIGICVISAINKIMIHLMPFLNKIATFYIVRRI